MHYRNEKGRFVRPPTREEWLKFRQGFTGASEIAALLHCHPYTTLAPLWAMKTGRLDPEPENAAMKRGKYLEETALRLLADERPDWQIAANVIPGGYLVADDESRICATPDATATRPDKPGEGIIQVKSVDQFTFKKNWLNDGEIDPPEHVVIQTLTEMYMTGAAWGVIAALVVHQGIDLHLVEVEPIEGLIEKLIAKNKDFWRFVETNECPPFDYGRDLKLIAQLHRGLTPDKTIDLSGDNAFLDAIHNYQEAKAQIGAIEKAKATAEAEIRAKIGDATAAEAGDYFVTLKQVNRAEHMVKASSFRQLRVKDRS